VYWPSKKMRGKANHSDDGGLGVIITGADDEMA
jgi:hypothetical protein